MMEQNRTCPKCGAFIAVGDSKCELCGEVLDSSRQKSEAAASPRPLAPASPGGLAYKINEFVNNGDKSLYRKILFSTGIFTIFAWAVVAFLIWLSNLNSGWAPIVAAIGAWIILISLVVSMSLFIYTAVIYLISVKVAPLSGLALTAKEKKAANDRALAGILIGVIGSWLVAGFGLGWLPAFGAIYFGIRASRDRESSWHASVIIGVIVTVVTIFIYALVITLTIQNKGGM
jgi:hypothetical protein